ncbi:MAG: DNA ligase [Acidimicrobiia bacterium]|nr:DNA ligase [Acidimicrobiia bacterium]
MLASTLSVDWGHEDWMFEVKFDGVRGILAYDGRDITITSRKGNPMAVTYPELSGFITDEPCVIDGEIIALDQAGNPSFGRLQTRMNIKSRAGAADAVKLAPVTFMAFDVLYYQEPVIDLPWSDRRHLLESMRFAGAPVLLSPIEEDGSALWTAVTERALEGMVGKLKSSPYQPGVRSPDWRKIPFIHQLRAVIGGFTRGERSRASTFGSLLLGLRDGDRLRYIGSVGTGFDQPTLRAVKTALDQMTQADSPFHPDTDLPAGSVFVNPDLVAVIEYKEWTGPGRLRAPSFKGFTNDPWYEVTVASEGPGADR